MTQQHTEQQPETKPLLHAPCHKRATVEWPANAKGPDVICRVTLPHGEVLDTYSKAEISDWLYDLDRRFNPGPDGSMW